MVDLVNLGVMLVAIVMLAAFVEGVVEYFVKPWLPTDDAVEAGRRVKRTMILRYSSALVGMGICLIYGADMFGAVLGLVGLAAPIPFVGELLTGVVVGRGANYAHDFIKTRVVPVISRDKELVTLYPTEWPIDDGEEIPFG